MDAEITTGSAEPGQGHGGGSGQLHVTVLGSPLRPDAIAAVAGRIAASGANIDRITRLASDPVTCIELDVSGAEPAPLRTALAQVAADSGVDVAVQRGGLHRRAMRLIVMDVDSTLIQDEVIDLLAARAGCADGGRQGHRVGDARRTGLRRLAARAHRAARRARRVGPRLGARQPPADPGGAHAGPDTQASRLQVRDRQRRLHRGDRAARHLSRHRLRGREHARGRRREADRAGTRADHRQGGEDRGAAQVRPRGGRPAVADHRRRRRRQRPRHDRARPASASRSTPSPWSRTPPTPRSTSRTSTRSCTCSASPATR